MTDTPEIARIRAYFDSGSSLYTSTGDVKEINTLLINRGDIRAVLARVDTQAAEIKRLNDEISRLQVETVQTKWL